MSSDDRFPPGFAPVYIVHLLYPQEPLIDRQAITARVLERLPKSELIVPDTTNEVLLFGHPDFHLETAEGPVVVQTMITRPTIVRNREKIELALRQNWNFPEAPQLLSQAQSTIWVNDLFCSGLEPKVRLRILQAVLLSTIELAPPLALYFAPSEKLVEPAAFRHAMAPGSQRNELFGAVNVRLFQIEDTERDMVMDTLGLGALGLPDIQMHFRDLDPNEVAALLFNFADYLFENGDVIENGHTVAGIREGQKWHTQHEKAIVAPDRVVVDINPGAPFAAGNR